MTDIQGSTELLRRLGKAAYEELLEAHRTILTTAVERFAGRMVDTQGDATFAAFGRPSDAVRAAADARRMLGAADWPGGAPPRVRMGIHTGEAMPTGENYHGLAVHRRRGSARRRPVGRSSYPARPSRCSRTRTKT